MQLKTEYILIAMLVLAVFVVACFRMKQGALLVNANVPDDTSQDEQKPSGPAYLVYNAPYGFSPPNQNVIPNKVASFIGAPTLLPKVPA